MKVSAIFELKGKLAWTFLKSFTSCPFAPSPSQMQLARAQMSGTDVELQAKVIDQEGLFLALPGHDSS